MNKAITITPTENGFIVEVPNNSDILQQLASTVVEIAQEFSKDTIQIPTEAFDAIPLIQLKPKTYVFTNYATLLTFLDFQLGNGSNPTEEGAHHTFKPQFG